MAIEGAYERQLRFPLDTANQLRGRLRREHFTIFKKGSKGVSYVCAVKRKFRVPGQVFGESIGSLISFIEEHPLVKAGELASKMLGIDVPAEGASYTLEQKEKIVRMQGDLIWLVREGYVTEFIDGGLYAPPPMVEARKKEVEAEDIDPENFPEAPRPAAEPPAPPAGPAEVAAAEAPVSEVPAPAAAAPEAPAERRPSGGAGPGRRRAERAPSHRAVGRLAAPKPGGSNGRRRPRSRAQGARRRPRSSPEAARAIRPRGTRADEELLEQEVLGLTRGERGGRRPDARASGSPPGGACRS
jgi:hypothetical protein